MSFSIPDRKTVETHGPSQTVFVNLYTTTRHYGGPEEGGWWWDYDNCELSIPTLNQAELVSAIFDFMSRKVEEEELSYGDINSVLGGQDAWVCVELTPAESQTTERPTYE